MSTIGCMNTTILQQNLGDENFEKLWKRLKNIRYKYKKPSLSDECKELKWEAEVAYNQGKLLEEFIWTGEKPSSVPEIAIPYVTYNKMNREQLKYYIYWRTQFRSGKVIDTGYRSYYYLCAYELLADFGPFTCEQRLEQLELLYSSIKTPELTNIKWVWDYAKIHNLKIQDEYVYDKVKSYDDEEIKPVDLDERYVSRDFTDALSVLNRHSKYKTKSSAYVKKTNCVESLNQVICNIVSELDSLFENNGIDLMDFTVGKKRVKLVRDIEWPYDGSIWDEQILKKMSIPAFQTEYYIVERLYPNNNIIILDDNGNPKSSTNIRGRDLQKISYYPYLSEFILRYTEFLFRSKTGYRKCVKPEELTFAFRLDEDSWYTSADPTWQAKEKILFSLFDSITSIIDKQVAMFFNTHSTELNRIKERLENQ